MRLLSALLLAATFLGTAPAARADEPPPPATPPHSAEDLARRWQRLDQLHVEALEDERRLMLGLVGASLVSTAAGAGLMVTDQYDQGLRIAGAVTIGFAVIDVALAAGALAGQKEQRAAWAKTRAQGGDLRVLLVEEGRFARDQGQMAWVFALNLGLDAGYIMAGAAGAAASAFSVEHPDRWLAGGLAAVAQGIILVGIDTVGLLRAKGHQSAALDSLAGLALRPSLTVPAPSGTLTGGGLVAGLSGRF